MTKTHMAGIRLENYDQKEVAGKTTSHQLAHFLDWCARKHEGISIALPVCAKVVFRRDRLPARNSDDVKAIRSAMQRTRAILVKIYARELDSDPAFGIRATSSASDILTTTVPKREKRMRTAQARLAETVDLIDVKELPDTIEMKPWKAHLRGLHGLLRDMADPSFSSKLLPPAPEEDTE